MKIKFVVIVRLDRAVRGSSWGGHSALAEARQLGVGRRLDVLNLVGASGCA